MLKIYFNTYYLENSWVVGGVTVTCWMSSGFLQLTQSIPSEISAQVVSSVGEYRRLVLQGRFNEDDDFSAILKTIAALEERSEDG